MPRIHSVEFKLVKTHRIGIVSALAHVKPNVLSGKRFRQITVDDRLHVVLHDPLVNGIRLAQIELHPFDLGRRVVAPFGIGFAVHGKFGAFAAVALARSRYLSV
ncbi:hypothetical protein D3C76_1292340 [compost metagenome]